eukprot:3452929-Pleurochrysis_carterae.AAC.1
MSSNSKYPSKSEVNYATSVTFAEAQLYEYGFSPQLNADYGEGGTNILCCGERLNLFTISTAFNLTYDPYLNVNYLHRFNGYPSLLPTTTITYATLS